jgi:hypothetical protein
VESELTPTPMPEEAPKSKNFFSLLGGVFFSPRESFQEIGRKPAMAIPIIVLFILTVLSTYYTMKKVDTQAGMQARLEQAVAEGKITEEQMNQQLAIMSKAGAPVGAVFTGVVSLVLCLIIAGFGKLFSTFIGSENQFKTLFVVSMYAVIAVSFVQFVLTVIILQLKQPAALELADTGSILASNLGSVLEIILGVDALPKFVVALAKGVDIFGIWMIALLASGFSAVSKKLKTSSAAIWLGTAYAFIFLIIAVVA